MGFVGEGRGMSRTLISCVCVCVCVCKCVFWVKVCRNLGCKEREAARWQLDIVWGSPGELACQGERV